MEYFEGLEIKSADSIRLSHEKCEFENCTFINCDFSDLDLSDFIFVDSNFTDCNFSLAKTANTAFRNIIFKDCKIIGLNFDQCNLFGLKLHFDGCILDDCLFFKLKLSGTIFKNSHLHRTDFSECDLRKTSFINCDLKNSVFDHTDLSGADLSTAFDFNIDPEKNKLTKAKFSISGLPGLLIKHKLDIEI
jgi:fluoroquinolone resistance protein